MTDSSTADAGPTPEMLLAAGGQVDEFQITAPAKVEILAINTDQALVRVIAPDGDTESFVVEIERPKSDPPAGSDERTATSQGVDG